MILLRKLLFPFAILYGVITSIRNFLYDRGLLQSHLFPIPVIAVGNLSVGGTGKTPQIEYLIRLLSEKYKIATLSRGYKRKTAGFILADDTATADILGDEPFQFHQKFPDIQVAVDADRKNGIEKLLALTEKPQVILLDDAFQHRKVKAGFYILLTAYGDLFADDFMLPTGNLRESRSGAKRADLIVVTKCPKDLSEAEQKRIRLKLQAKKDQSIYFSFIDYDTKIYSQQENVSVSNIKASDKVLLAGIAKPESFFNYLKNPQDVIVEFPDHHHFSAAEIDTLNRQSAHKKIITTEKDYVRLKDSVLAEKLFYLPIKTSFLSQSDEFDRAILNYAKGL